MKVSKIELGILKVKTKKEEFDPKFLELWEKYPKKTGKKLANIAYKRLLKKYSHEEIKNAMILYIEEKKDTDKQYIKQGNTFFAERIYDYIDLANGVVKKEKKKGVYQTIYTPEIEKAYDEMLKMFNKFTYDQYLITKHWQHFRKEAIIHAKNECQLCMSTDILHVHHKTYENRGRETFNDVIVLCSECHRMVHKKE